ncbi:prokineticin receptor 1a [Boleophthalmus pectinirostris]|uniref:prokineticin receptor 1a n=1 Tax=Boleophthalmus pectinirostris TaxID=150288 RepID=UPI002432C03F|nr:prokineticin receptor 1a [Boleophthalmus pectinirostris]
MSSNLSSETNFYENDVDYQVSLEDVGGPGGVVFSWAAGVMAAALVLIMAVCGLGNLVLVRSLVRSGGPRSLAGRLVLHLALSDALAALCCPLLLDYYTVRGLSWRFGWSVCAAVGYVRALSLHVSTNALLGIALDRYLAIVHPLRPRCHRSWPVVVGVWLVPALVSVPVVLTSAQTQFSGADGVVKTFCGQVWSVDHRSLYQTYFLSVMILQFLFPVGVMTFCYSQVCRELWFKTVPGFQTAQVRLRVLGRRRTVLVLVLVLVLYVVCWSPYYIFSLLRDFHSSFMSSQRHGLTVFYAVDCLAMSNGVINTLAFVWVKRPDRTGTGPGSRTGTRLRLNTFTETKSNVEDNRTTSTKGTETETRRGLV